MFKALQDKDEHIEFEIIQKKHLPFHLNDFVLLLIIIGISIAGIASIRSDGFLSIGTVFFCLIILQLFRWFLRWHRIQPLRYYLTNKRLIFVNIQTNEVVRSFNYTNFPEIHFHENAYNKGYIVFGQKEPFFVETITPISFSSGLNIKEKEVIIENIPDVKIAFNRILVKIERKE